MNVYNFEEARQARSSASLKQFVKLIDTALRFIIGKPQVQLREVMWFLAERVGKLIRLLPEKDRQKYLKITLDKIQQVVDKK